MPLPDQKTTNFKTFHNPPTNVAKARTLSTRPPLRLPFLLCIISYIYSHPPQTHNNSYTRTRTARTATESNPRVSTDVEIFFKGVFSLCAKSRVSTTRRYHSDLLLRSFVVYHSFWNSFFELALSCLSEQFIRCVCFHEEFLSFLSSRSKTSYRFQELILSDKLKMERFRGRLSY